MEVQIRTKDMHNYAENGIASHWRYKEDKEGAKVTEQESQRFAWLRSLLDWQRELKDPNEFLTSVRQSLYAEDAYVYVFTPNGDVRELPKGATPVDFAYTIHTQVGHNCTGARVNGAIAKLNYQLHNGDTIEIITVKNGSPSKDWLNFVVTTKARNRIRQWYKVEERDRALSLGREILEKELRKENLNFNQLLKSGDLEKAAKEMGQSTVDEDVGLGRLRQYQPSPGHGQGQAKRRRSFIYGQNGASDQQAQTYPGRQGQGY